ncbi:hypothetical protein [uncultured Lamprocystis sp.]|jgi:hypothetical protein|nr:hypothetical protein [uncultured Lamprocystis sp.]
MSAPTFDTHKLIRTLKDSGIPENQVAGACFVRSLLPSIFLCNENVKAA